LPTGFCAPIRGSLGSGQDARAPTRTLTGLDDLLDDRDQLHPAPEAPLLAPWQAGRALNGIASALDGHGDVNAIVLGDHTTIIENRTPFARRDPLLMFGEDWRGATG
jgi:hypothetical protein